MKHLFKLVDKLMELLTELPPQLRSDDDVNKSKDILNQVDKYTWKIEKLIQAHAMEEHLTKLHELHIEEIPDWADKISEVFKKLDNLMRVIHEDIPKLRAILEKRRTFQNEKNSNEWMNKFGDFSMGMWMTGLHDAEKELDYLRQAETLKKEHIMDILGNMEWVEDVID